MGPTNVEFYADSKSDDNGEKNALKNIILNEICFC